MKMNCVWIQNKQKYNVELIYKAFKTKKTMDGINIFHQKSISLRKLTSCEYKSAASLELVVQKRLEHV